MSRGTISDWKIGRLFFSVTAQRPDVTMGKDGENLIFYGPTRTTSVNTELVIDCASIDMLAALILSGLAQ